MGEHKVKILRKLSKRRKMFEDYIVLVGKQASGESSPGAVAREEMRAGWMNNLHERNFGG